EARRRRVPVVKQDTRDGLLGCLRWFAVFLRRIRGLPGKTLARDPSRLTSQLDLGPARSPWDSPQTTRMERRRWAINHPEGNIDERRLAERRRRDGAAASSRQRVNRLQPPCPAGHSELRTLLADNQERERPVTASLV